MGSYYTSWQAALLVATCGLIVAGTIVGNALVCTAVAIVRKLRTPSNLLIVSLAVSDLLVAVLVMPFATTYEVMGRWVAGQAVCDMWTSLDVMLCTASILNLCMISVDRYFVITRPFQYAMKRTPARMTIMIVSVWLISALISIPPLFSGWKAPEKADECTVSQNVSYQFYATIGAFYLPLTVMIVIYYRIYMVSSRIADAEAKSKPNGSSTGFCAPASRLQCVTYTPGGQLADTVSKGSGVTDMTPGENGSQRRNVDVSKMTHQDLNPTPPFNGCRNVIDSTNLQLLSPGKKKATSPTNKVLPAADKRKTKSAAPTKAKRPMSLSSECKATKTLGIIMGAFTACWLPFFILALVKPFCTDSRSPDYSSCIPHWLNSLFQWLGYANSFLNPIIYARFNREFRTPFKEILLMRCRGINVRLRTETYAEQFGGAVGPQREQCRSRVTNSTIVQYKYQGRPVVKLDDRPNNGQGGDIPKIVEGERVTDLKNVTGADLDATEVPEVFILVDPIIGESPTIYDLKTADI